MDVDGRIRRDGNWALSRLRRPGVLHSTQEVRRFSPLHTTITQAQGYHRDATGFSRDICAVLCERLSVTPDEGADGGGA